MTAWLRATLFNLAFYLNGALWVVLCLPLIWLPHRGVMTLVKGWAASCVWLMRVVGGIDYEIRGKPVTKGPLIIASKHQSVFETFALLPLYDDPTYILKRELNWIPVFGWWSVRARMIPVDRGKGSEAMRRMARIAGTEVRTGRQIIIFPEGTRRLPGAPPSYRQGVGHLYEECGVPCQPVALDSGLYWPRRKWLHHPGTVLVEFLEPIPPGLSRETFMAQLEARIEEASDRLLVEAANRPDAPPMHEPTRRRVHELAIAHKSRTSC
jgi:1-acyl-sn-glycerol-3-phosphate acyltransferase